LSEIPTSKQPNTHPLALQLFYLLTLAPEFGLFLLNLSLLLLPCLFLTLELISNDDTCPQPKRTTNKCACTLRKSFGGMVPSSGVYRSLIFYWTVAKHRDNDDWRTIRLARQKFEYVALRNFWDEEDFPVGEERRYVN
jgi:hypothetical protein